LGRVAGRHSALLKELRRAFARSERTREGCLAIESVRIVEEAVRSGLRFRAVFFAESAEPTARRLLPQLGSHVETLLVPDRLFADVVATESPQGVAALVHLKDSSLEDALRAPEPLVLFSAGIQDPGHLGTMIRSAEAFGVGGVLLGEKTVSPFNPKVVRAAAGSLFRLPVVPVALAETIGTLRGRGLRVVAASAHKGTRLDQARLDGPLAVVVGNEATGVPRDVLKLADELVMIPHAPRVESLNAAVATSIVFYEAARQRRAGDGGPRGRE
jgi:TrmH family RNA methyltransferase